MIHTKFGYKESSTMQVLNKQVISSSPDLVLTNQTLCCYSSFMNIKTEVTCPINTLYPIYVCLQEIPNNENSFEFIAAKCLCDHFRFGIKYSIPVGATGRWQATILGNCVQKVKNRIPRGRKVLCDHFRQLGFRCKGVSDNHFR